MKYYVGIDIGTSSTKVEFFSQNFVSLFSRSYPYEMISLNNGWAEQDPEDWFEAVFDGISEGVSSIIIQQEDELTIALTGQMHGIVLLDDKNKILRPAILWCDQRTGKQVSQMEADLGEKILQETANPAMTGFSAAKLLWVKENEPEIFSKIKMVLLPKDYIRYRLSNDFSTEFSDASGLQLLNIKKRQYSRIMLDYIGLDESMLPRLCNSSDITGFLNQDMQEHFGLKQKVAIVAGAGDNAASAIGVGVINDGDTFISLGTSGVVFTQTDQMHLQPEGRVHTFCSAVGNTWHVMGVTQGAGSSIEKGKELFFENEDFEQINKKLEFIAPGSDKLIYLPYLMGERTPHLDPSARAVFFGLSAIHTKEHMMKSILEGVCFSIKDCVSIISEMDIQMNKLKVTGGASQSDLMMKTLSNVLGDSVVAIEGSAGTTRGCAMLAALAKKDVRDLQEAWSFIEQHEKVYGVDESVHKSYEDYYLLYNKLYQSLKEDYIALEKIGKKEERNVKE